MCIILAKPAGVAMPDSSIISECWENNPDGAGYMYASKGIVYIEKGIMTFDGLTSKLNALAERFDLTKLPLVVHFRISTQAGVNPQNTHPFPITRDDKLLGARASSSTVGAMAHNGIIPCCSTYDKKETRSDTWLFVRDYVAKFAERDKKLLREDWIQTMIQQATSSKLAFMFPNGDIVLLGKFEREKGIAYSNGTYKEQKKLKYTGPYSYPGYTSDYGYSGLSGYGIYDDEAQYPATNSAHKESKAFWGVDYAMLYECDESMCIYDESVDEFVECDPDFHFYDESGELWELDDMSGEECYVGSIVYDHNLVRVKPPKPVSEAV